MNICDVRHYAARAQLAGTAMPGPQGGHGSGRPSYRLPTLVKQMALMAEHRQFTVVFSTYQSSHRQQFDGHR
jgi:hypothetical protein